MHSVLNYDNYNDNSNAYNLLNLFYYSRQEGVVPFFQFLENNSSIAEKVFDSSISQTTLEEVFLNVSTCQSISFLLRIIVSSSNLIIVTCY